MHIYIFYLCLSLFSVENLFSLCCILLDGPDTATLEVNEVYTNQSLAQLHVTCHVTTIQPITAAVVEWEGLCQGHRGFTCNLTSVIEERGRSVDGEAVVCRVINLENHNVSAAASINLLLKGPGD